MDVDVGVLYQLKDAAPRSLLRCVWWEAEEEMVSVCTRSLYGC